MTETLDPAALLKLRELESRGTPGATQRITSAFLADAPVKINALWEALAVSDAQAVSMAAHTLKGGCWYVGAKRLAELCELLEESAEAGDLTGVDAGIIGIETELLAVREAMQRALSTDS